MNDLSGREEEVHQFEKSLRAREEAREEEARLMAWRYREMRR